MIHSSDMGHSDKLIALTAWGLSGSGYSAHVRLVMDHGCSGGMAVSRKMATQQKWDALDIWLLFLNETLGLTGCSCILGGLCLLGYSKTLAHSGMLVPRTLWML